ncbi:MAG: hypothetical protein ACYC3K_04490 [Candidatus Nanopelagicales bacterium]
MSDAQVMDAVRDAAWTVDADGPLAGVRRLTPEGLYGRRKMTALVKRSLPEASPGSVDRAMKALGLNGIRRAKGIRTTIPGKDGRRAGDLLNRDFTAAAPNRTWVMDFLCRRRHRKSYADLWTMPISSLMGLRSEGLGRGLSA